MLSVQLTSKANLRDTDVLVVHCGDHRIQSAIHEFLNRVLELSENYALLAIPGGPQCLTLVEYLPKFSWASWRWFKFLKHKHESRRLILIAHQDCHWYEGLPFHLHTSSDPRHRQEEDLRRARKSILEEFPDLTVEMYYAGWDTSDQVSIETISG